MMNGCIMSRDMVSNVYYLNVPYEDNKEMNLHVKKS